MDVIKGKEAGANNPVPMDVDQESLTEEEGQTAAPMAEDDPQTKLNKIMQKQPSQQLVRNWQESGEVASDAVLTALTQSKAAFENVFGDLVNKFWFESEEHFQEVRNTVYEACRMAGLANPTNNTDARLASLTLGLNQDYKGQFDFKLFVHKIEKSFDWYKGDHEKFISPSFAIIQSSGMGKTKLMKQYKTTMPHQDNSLNTDVKLLLCRYGDQALPDDYQTHFDCLLEVPCIPLDRQDTKLTLQEKEKMLSFLEGLVSKSNKEKIVLLFDEAHVLVWVHEGGFYVALRWWLRQVRSDNKKIVAVFAGTLLSLANYQRVQPALGWTRGVSKKYVNYSGEKAKLDLAKKLYDPFYTFTTMAMEHVRVAEAQRGHKDFKDALYDIRSCGYFGRPLFLAMLKASSGIPELTLAKKDAIVNNGSGKIVNGRLYNIMARVLLSEPVNWREKEHPVASVLATRVQLGIASYDFVTKATSKGYANLVHFRGGDFSSDDTDIRRFGSAGIAFPPDPVCAALAMGLMQDSWSLSKDSGGPDEIVGANPCFWVSQARMVFEQRLFLPNRGDAGEVFAALYMLLCGDMLRKDIDPCMRKFEIDLIPWLSGLEEEFKKRKADSSAAAADDKAAAADDTAASSSKRKSARVAHLVSTERVQSPSGNQSDPVQGGAKLNFIQVVRNYFRTHAWFSQEYLKYMYDTAVACYVYANCPAFDVVFPVKVDDAYCPALVSIKCWDAIGALDMKDAVQDMKEYLRGYREDVNVKAFCILIVIGSQVVGNKPASEGVFPHNDAFVTVVVPKNDRFGVTNAIIATATASVRAEVLACHSFAHVEDQRYNPLRASTRAPDREFGDALIADQQQSEQMT